MLVRVVQRIATTGCIKIPAVPDLADEYVKLCASVFAASGRGFHDAELVPARNLIQEKLDAAFDASPRSKIEIAFESESARPLGFVVHEDIRSIPDAYERWIGSSEGPLFGAHPDARVVDLANLSATPSAFPILDFGAGTGRNALGLARRGFPVDAVEITPKFAEMLSQAAAAEQLLVRVVAEDVFENANALRRDYQLLFASEVVPDFRGVADLRKLFALASEVLADGGTLLFNVHLCAKGYNPDKAARELAQQCYSSLFTPSEIVQAMGGLPFELTDNHSVHDYEKAHLPQQAFPPTPWYVNWITGLDVYETDVEKCPIELRWLTFKKQNTHSLGIQPHAATRAASTHWADQGSRPRRFDPQALRAALARRLLRRMSAAGSLVLPAIPDLLDPYTSQCLSLFVALGRQSTSEHAAEFRRNLATMLDAAFAASSRSNVVVTYEVTPGSELKYSITADPTPLAQAYEQWHASLPEPMFGWDPDARLVALIPDLKLHASKHVLDVGAGLGRNAMYLAQQGFHVDALEMTPKFVSLFGAEITHSGANVQLLERDLLRCSDGLREDYALALLSGVAGDLRDGAQLRQLLEILCKHVAIDGLLLLNLHLAVEGYTPTEAARQWGQQCCAMFVTREELRAATEGLPIVPMSEEPAYDFERANLPAENWPPTSGFTEWALGQHMFAVDRDHSPIQLRWLTYRRVDAASAPAES